MIRRLLDDDNVLALLFVAVVAVVEKQDAGRFQSECALRSSCLIDEAFFSGYD